MSWSTAGETETGKMPETQPALLRTHMWESFAGSFIALFWPFVLVLLFFFCFFLLLL